MLNCERIRKDLQTAAATPLHARLRQAIYAQLMDGTLRPGEALPPERVLKEELGISRTPIRQAIKSLIDEGLLRAVVGAGTFVLEPQQQTPAQNPLIGIAISDTDYSVYYPELAPSLSYGLRQAGYRVDISIHNDRYETLNEVVSSLLAQNAKAVVIVAPNQQGTEGTIRFLQKKGIITLLLTRYLENCQDVDYIGADNHLIGVQATQHLIELGHTGILHLAGGRTSTAYDRAAGYVQAMEQAGLTPKIFLAPGENGPLPVEVMSNVMDVDTTQLWMQIAQKKITAVFSFNDQISTWFQKELRWLNLSIPRDVSLISVDNMPYAGFFDTPLTTFALPGEEIGTRAAALLLRRLADDSLPPQRILLPARLIQRLSTTPLVSAPLPLDVQPEEKQ